MRFRKVYKGLRPWLFKEVVEFEMDSEQNESKSDSPVKLENGTTFATKVTSSSWKIKASDPDRTGDLRFTKPIKASFDKYSNPMKYVNLNDKLRLFALLTFP